MSWQWATTAEVIPLPAEVHSSGLDSLPRLLDRKLIKRRVPATVPLYKIKTSQHSRYYLGDPFLRFYYRFVDPNLHLIERGLTHRLWQMMAESSAEDNSRAFVALTFEDVCRDWVLKQAQTRVLPFAPDNVGSHWSKAVQVDVVAIAWRERQILLGECKWGDHPLGRSVVVELIEEKTEKMLRDLPDEGESGICITPSSPALTSPPPAR